MPNLEEKSRSEWVKIWKSRISIATRKHKKKVMDWANKVIQEYTGDFKEDIDTGEAYSQICQITMAVEETVQPHLFFQNPRMIAYAKKKKSVWERRTEFVQEVVNHEYSAVGESGYGIELENELALLDARLLGYGATETRYDVEGKFLEEPETDPGLIEKAKNFLTGENAPVKRTPVITKEKGSVTERVSPLDIMLDPAAKHITKMKYFIKKKDFSFDDLKDIKYDQDKVANLQPTLIFDRDIEVMSDEERKRYAEENPDYKGFRGFEIHDLENHAVHTMIEGFEDFIEFGTPELVREGSNFAFLWFIDSPDDAYPQAPYKYYRKRALEFSYVYSQVADQIDKFLPRIGVNKDLLSKPDQIKLEKGRLGTIFGVSGPPANAAAVFSPQVQSDFFKYLSMVKELLNLESGSNEYELAVAETNSETKATEINKVSQGTTARRFKPKKRVAGFIKAQANIIWQVARDNRPIEFFIQVLGEKDALDWWNDAETGKAAWETEDALLDYWFDFDVESMAPIDSEKRKMENERSLNTVLNPGLREGLALEGKTLLISPIFEKYAKVNLGVNDLQTIVKDQNLLSADEEHSMWMQGQFPPISPDEANNPALLMENFKKHDAFVKSPGFQSLPPELKEPGYEHRDSYIPLLQQLQQKQSPQKQPAAKPQLQTA